MFSRLRSAILATALAALCLSCSLRTRAAGVELPRGRSGSAQPPGGLAMGHVPLFVQFGFDDNGISGREGSGTVGGLSFVSGLFAGKRNQRGRGNPRTYDGTPALFSLYVATRYIETAETDAPEHVKRAWRAIVDAGHEIGLHTHRHAHGAAFDVGEWASEIVACRNWLAKPFAAARAAEPGVGIGVPPAGVVGFRAPFLEYGPALFQALRTEGILYDCSVEEGFEDHFDGGNMVWPYRVAPGLGGGWAADVELWELPVYALIVPPDEECERYGVSRGLRARLHQVQDYFDPADGKITGFDWNLWVEFGMTGPEVVATFKYSLDRRLAGNRAPLTFGTHSDIYSEQYPAAVGSSAEQRRKALAEILDWALGHVEVRVVSAKQLLDWLRDPAPL